MRADGKGLIFDNFGIFGTVLVMELNVSYVYSVYVGVGAYFQ